MVIENPAQVTKVLRSILKIQTNDGTTIDWPQRGGLEPIQISDQLWSNSFGGFQRKARGIVGHLLVTLDFSMVEWADPLPLLSICSTIREVMEAPQTNLRLIIGSVGGATRRRSGFLKFLAQQGFIECLWIEGRTTFDLGGTVGDQRVLLIAAIEEARNTAIYMNSRAALLEPIL